MFDGCVFVGTKRLFKAHMGISKSTCLAAEMNQICAASQTKLRFYFLSCILWEDEICSQFSQRVRVSFYPLNDNRFTATEISPGGN